MRGYIIRHADKAKGTFFNPALHHEDPPISPAGLENAGRLAAYFSGRQIDAIYISAYQRTGQTAAPLAQQRDLTPIVDPRLNEIDNGAFDRLSLAEIQAAYPQAWQAFVERRADFRFPGGETGEEASGRIAGFIEERLAAGGEGTFLAVTHEGLIRLLMCRLMNLPVYKRWNFHVDPCGIMEITYQPEYGEWKLVRFNQVCAVCL